MMSGFWRRVRLTPTQLGLIGLASAGATAFVITAALGRTAAQTAALAALRTRRVEVRVQSPPDVPAPAAGAAPLSSPAPVPVAAPSAGPTPPTVSQAPTSTSSDQNVTSTPDATTPAHSRPASRTAKLGHVFVIALTTPSFDAAFGSSSVAHYLNHTLVPKGTLLGGYETLGNAELPDYLAMISGQAPNPDTSGECQTYSDFAAGAAPSGGGQVPGTGCVYPNTVLTIGDQVTAGGRAWKAYIDGVASSSCPHPNSGAATDTPPPGASADYSLLHNPFIFFHSLLDLGGCASNDVSLDRLRHDLVKPARTPSYAFIAPGVCLDAAAASCPTGAPAGLAGEDDFLRIWVPRILHSTAYKRSGALIIVFALPDASMPGGGSGSAPTGALLLSPRAARRKIVSTTFNPYSVLRTVEDLLGYKRLAGARSARSFAAEL
jgi:hypothetical protein